MWSRLFPRVLDNHYRGHPLALWLLVPVVLLKGLMGFNCAGLNPFVDNRSIIEGVDGIPLAAFPAQAVDAITFLFSSWGLGLLLLALLALIGLLRYRSMIPLLYLLLGAEQVGRKFLTWAHPIERSVGGSDITPGLVINWSLTAVLVVGFVLSLLAWRRDAPRFR
jgi:xanthosine utilization system XapX-like protein